MIDANPPTSASIPEIPGSPAPAAGVEPGEITLSEDLWPNVDWDAVREKTPGSLVWTETMPPDDEAERARRAAKKSADNVVWGRIQAGMAEDDEIDGYYDARERLLTDNLELVGLLLEDHRSAIPERDQGLLEMAFRMTYKRLEQLPDERARAYGWKAEHAARRAATPSP